MNNEQQKAVTKLRHLLMAPLQIDFVLVSEASEAVIRELEQAQRERDDLRAKLTHTDHALSTTCDQSILDELKRKTEALESLLVPIPIDKTRTDEFYKGQVNALLMVQEVARAALQPK